jgi:pSer/pThr/pTyr-binding forkhead associated (FHA) protein
LVDRDSEITDVGQHATTGDLCLLVLEDSGLTRHSLPLVGTLSVGRAEAADICLSDRLASRHHLLLHVGETLAVEDTHSANGTRIRGEAIAPGQRVAVEVGEAIYVGGTMLVVRSAKWTRPTPPRPNAPRARGTREVERLKKLRALEKLMEAPSTSPRRG